ncbi:MAG TPA: hypothetical protein VH640_25340 [Bryobacteraceae bacterium]|jgi:hypothetical protein
MKITAAAGTSLLALTLHAQTVTEASDRYHLLGWLDSGHLADYTEWWYFNIYDATNNVQAIFSYLINNPLNLSGGLARVGISEMAAVAYTPGGIVPEADIYFTPAFSANTFKADATIGTQNSISVIDDGTYQIAGATRDGKIDWNLLYQRTAPSWFAANRFSVAAQPWELMSWLLYMPAAAVSGTLTVNGTSYQVNATGYHDHNWGEWDLTGIPWNWAQFSQPNLTFDLGDFPTKPGGFASVEVNGHRYIFQNSQYTLTYTQWAYDPKYKVNYPTQSVFHANNGTAQMNLTMNVIATEGLAPPNSGPTLVIYEQTTSYTGQVTIGDTVLNLTADGFKEYSAMVP